MSEMLVFIVETQVLTMLASRILIPELLKAEIAKKNPTHLVQN
jgi:hypothetical protein